MKTEAWKRYNARTIWVSLAYAVFLIGAVFGFKHHLFEGPVRYVVAVLPALPIIGLFVAMGRYLVEEQDEYVRMLMVRQTLWASGFALSAATIWGFLQNFDLIGPVDGYWIVVVWYFGLGIGSVANKLSLGDGGC
jgi:nitric oxide reductase large subunit